MLGRPQSSVERLKILISEGRTPLKDVKPTEDRQLPDRYDLAHAVAFFFHDQLARLVTDLSAVGALSVHLELQDDESAQIASLAGEDLWAWLQNRGLHDVVNDLTYRQLTAAVVSDAAHFLCESLLSCAKGKTQVAYSLLRKPLKEDLLLLEWLVADPDDFLERFKGDTIEPYVLNRLPLDKRKAIVNEAAARVQLPGIDGELLWLVRYGKEYPNSLETMWTKATHLVTSVSSSATEPGNLNFVFSTATAVEEHWEHFYRMLPLLLYYFLSVAEKVASRFVEWEPELRPTQTMLRTLAFIRYSQTYGSGAELQVLGTDLVDELANVELGCECGQTISIRTSGIDRLWLEAVIACPKCMREYSVYDILSNVSDDSPEHS